MAIQINCDRCKRFIKFVSKKELRDMEDILVCKSCKETEAKIRKDVEQIKNRALNTFTQHANELNRLIDEAVSKRIAEEE
jgi:hypothetical protein